MTARTSTAPRLAIVVSTYESAEPLHAVLWGLAEQSDPGFVLVVADDGSGSDTKAVVDRWRSRFGERLLHVWQPDEGFRLARVLNLGALAVDADYFAFMHGESIPRRNFVRANRACIRPGWFVAGRRVDLSAALTARVLEQRLPVHRWGMLDWLRVRHEASPIAALTRRDRRRVGVTGVPEFSPHNRTYGYLLGVGRRDFERVDGYDVRFVGWGEEDVDIATRLRRIGLRCGHAGPDGTLVHLWHESEIPAERPNWYLLQETEQSDRVEAIGGLREVAAAEKGTRASPRALGANRRAS
jgi:glycosyltransferase involved in cell wall biosynthesis